MNTRENDPPHLPLPATTPRENAGASTAWWRKLSGWTWGAAATGVGLLSTGVGTVLPGLKKAQEGFTVPSFPVNPTVSAALSIASLPILDAAYFNASHEKNAATPDQRRQSTATQAPGYWKKIAKGSLYGTAAVMYAAAATLVCRATQQLWEGKPVTELNPSEPYAMSAFSDLFPVSGSLG